MRAGFPDPVSRPLRHTSNDLSRRDVPLGYVGVKPQQPELCIILLASATLTSIGGLRASILASHDPGAAPLRARHTTSLLAPMIRSRRRDRSPIFVVELMISLQGANASLMFSNLGSPKAGRASCPDQARKLLLSGDFRELNLKPELLNSACDLTIHRFSAPFKS